MNRLLVLAYAYPPCGGAGVQRTAKFVRYLPAHGWQPTVLTVLPSCYGIQDFSQSAETPAGVEVVRTPHFDPVAALGRSDRGTASANGRTSDISGPERWTPWRIARRILRNGWLALENNVLVPDATVLWFPRALAAGRALIRRKRFDLIWATGEPYSSYLIARSLSTRLGIPFVIDMRDPWTMAPYRAAKRAEWRQSLERWQERRILDACRACIFAFNPEGLYTEAFPQWAGKFHYIPNGYDPADFAGTAPQHFDRFTIVHSGTFLSGYRPALRFLLALREVLNRQPDLESRVQVLFVGRPGEERRLIRELRLTEIVQQVGYLSHRESISYLLGADLLLLVGGHHRWEETGKVYEYLAARKPILALVHPQGNAARLLSTYPLARVVDRASTNDASTALEQFLAGDGTSPSQVNVDWAVQYERPRLTARLAAVLESCCPRT